jgi:hypothetical protein
LSKKHSAIQTFFSTTTYAASPYFGTLIWQAAQSGEMIKQLQKI